MGLDFYQFSTATVLLMLAAFYGGTYLLTLVNYPALKGGACENKLG